MIKGVFGHLAAAVALGAVMSNAQEPVQLPGAVVTGRIKPEPQFSLFSLGTTLREIPHSVTSIDQSLIRERQHFTLAEAVENVPGVVDAGTPLIGGGFIIRGFPIDFSGVGNLLNGHRDLNFAQLDAQALERIEVIRGASSFRFGRIQPGGAINRVTKQAVLGANFASVEQTFGSFETFQSVFDANVSFTEQLAVRIPASYLDRGSFRDLSYHEKNFNLLPTITYQPRDRTTVSVTLGHVSTTTPDAGPSFPSVNGRVLELRRGTFLGEPDGLHKSKYYRAAAELQHDLNERLSFTTSVSYWDYTLTQRGVTLVPPFIAPTVLPDNRTINRLLFTSNNDRYRNFQARQEFTTTLDLGATEQELTFGGEYRNFDHPLVNVSASLIAPNDTLNPTPNSMVLAPIGVLPSGTQTEEFGLFAQHRWVLLRERRGVHQLAIHSGGRLDFVDEEQQGIFSDYFSATPFAGLLWMPVERLSFYGTYSEGFNPQFGFDVSGRPYGPATSDQREFGIRWEPVKNLSAAATYFHINRQNVVQPSFFPSTPVAGENSRGVELELTGRLAPHTQVTAGYAYTDSEIKRDPVGGFTGNSRAGVPDHTVNLWLSHSIPRARRHELWGFGAGVYFVGAREGDQANSFQLESFARWDAAVWHQRKIRNRDVRFRLNIRNITNAEYFLNDGHLQGTTPGGAIPGAPLSIYGTIAIRF